MKKTIVTVFLIIGVLLICALVWDMVFNNGGIISTVWNGVTTPINNVWKAIAGKSAADLIPAWSTGSGASDHANAESANW